MEITKTLVLSTGHLPENEFSTLAMNGCFRAVKHEYGVIVILSSGESTLESIEGNEANICNAFPKLLNIVKYCAENDITYIDFDRDGGLYEEFEQFDW